MSDTKAKTKFKVGQRDQNHRVFLGWKLRHGEFDLACNGHWYNVADVHTDRAKMLVIRAKALVDEPSLKKIGIVPVWRPESQARAAVRAFFRHTVLADLSAPRIDLAFREAVVELLESHDICPCGSQLDDPGPTHLPSCAFADPNHDGGF